jgi:transcriptional regulator with XRE-family HTH domain
MGNDPTDNGGAVDGQTIRELRESLRDDKPRKARGSGSRREVLDPELERIAGRVRRWREEAGLTLLELARRSGVAASTIQKVESLQMVPTIGVLLKIARGLERTPSELVRDTSDELEVAHLRADERHPVGVGARMVVERMVGDLFEPTLEVWRISDQPGSGSGTGLIRHDGEQLIVGEVGVLIFRVGDQEYEVRAGDTLHFKASLAYGWENRGSGPSRFLIIGTLPRVLRAALHERMRASRDLDVRGAESA